jgi:hypothetical protein
MKRLLPIGIQDFATIRQDGYCYIDKTARIHELISGSGRTFFSLPPPAFREIPALFHPGRSI